MCSRPTEMRIRFRVGHAGRMLDQRIGVTETDGQGADLEIVEELRAIGAPAFDVESHHAPVTAHLPGSDLVLGMIFAAGIIHPLNLRV